MASRGKWFESKEHRTAKKFASEKQTNLWRVTHPAHKNRDGEKIPKVVRFYAGPELPKTASKLQIDPLVTK